MGQGSAVNSQPDGERALSISERAMARPAYVEGLNEEQRQAVEILDGPVLVLAGARNNKSELSMEMKYFIHNLPCPIYLKQCKKVSKFMTSPVI